MIESKPKVLAVASSGGHWVQLMRVLPAFEGAEVVFIAVDSDYRRQLPEHRVHVVNDANRWNRFGLLKLGLRVLRVVIRERPDVVFSTGAAPGFFALLLGRLTGARVIWLDSAANVEELSVSGRMVRPFSHLFLTQWPDLAEGGEAEFAGRVF
jgi:UDP-N-acetylglucosamine:LPS N-acetylglucosamine transferase